MERLTRKNKHEQWVAPFCTRYDDEELEEEEPESTFVDFYN